MAAIARWLTAGVRASACYVIRKMRPPRLPLTPFLIALAVASVSVGAVADTRPLIAVIAENQGTETTDFIVPYGVLSASGAARVVDVSVHDGPVQMMPALKLSAKETIASFDSKHPEGARYVVVPAMHDASEPTLIAWLQQQARGGATIVGVCDGVQVLAAAGLLEHRSATGHWYSRSSLERDYPNTRWVPNQRYVQDGAIITTTGVTASLPVSLALVEQLQGRDAASVLAQELGTPGWAPSHESARYHLTPRHLFTALWNLIAFWRYERVGVALTPGVDEISLSFTADALGRTYRATALSVAADDAPVVTKRGLTIIPDLHGAAADVDRIEPVPPVPAAQALDHALATIVRHDGEPTARFVALQLEYPW